MVIFWFNIYLCFTFNSVKREVVIWEQYNKLDQQIQGSVPLPLISWLSEDESVKNKKKIVLILFD